jgi:hypothetical protein
MLDIIDGDANIFDPGKKLLPETWTSFKNERSSVPQQ